MTRALVGRTVADVERDLILETLKHCLGNRTHAANILGISIRTLRNKLNEYADGGIPITPAGNWRRRLSAAGDRELNCARGGAKARRLPRVTNSWAHRACGRSGSDRPA